MLYEVITHEDLDGLVGEIAVRHGNEAYGVARPDRESLLQAPGDLALVGSRLRRNNPDPFLDVVEESCSYNFV